MTDRPAPVLDLHALDRLLRPHSIAIVGASPTPGALGASVLANLKRMMFRGQIHLVNPKRDSIDGISCLRTVAQLPLGVDTAVLAIPRAAVLETMRELAARKVGAAIIFSAGFAEGGAAGLQEQRELAAIAARSGMVVEGPNCLGLTNYVDGVALSFVATPAAALGGRRGVGIVSQSGAMAVVLATTLSAKGLGISYSVSTGNEAACGVEDFVDYLLHDAHTCVIALIVEQFRQPRRFLELAARARQLGKPIVLLHPGRSHAARESAATHTGAMAGNFAVMRVQVEHQGVILAPTLEAFADAAELALRYEGIPAHGPVVLTESGAFKALALDACDALGLPLPAVDDHSAPALRAALPEFVPVSNPVDLTAQSLVDPDLYRRTLSALLPDERFGSILLCIIQTDAPTAQLKFPPIIAAIEQLRPSKPVLFAGMDDGAEVPAHFIAALRALNVAYFPSPDRAFQAVALWHAARHEPRSAAPPRMRPSMQLERGVLAEYRCKQLLGPLGIAFPAGRLVSTLAEAQQAAEQLGAPVALKAQSADLPHKSDAGGVVLGLKDADAVADGWRRLHGDVARHRPGLRLDGVLVEKMSERGVELIIGGRNDPDWGPIVLAGFGGVLAEMFADVRLLPADLSVAGILHELHRLKSAGLLRGYRGSGELDVAAVAQIVACVAELLRVEPDIVEIDLNPVIVYPAGRGAMALDALMVVR